MLLLRLRVVVSCLYSVKKGRECSSDPLAAAFGGASLPAADVRQERVAPDSGHDSRTVGCRGLLGLEGGSLGGGARPSS